MRLFLALKTTPYVDKLYDVENKLQALFNGVKWVGRENLHLTLKFLGEFNELNLDNLNLAIKNVSDNFLPFNFSIAGISGFPNFSEARVLFFAIKNYEGQIVKLMQNIDNAVSDFGIQKEKSYIPHITFGRAKNRPVNLSNAVMDPFQIDSRASGIILFRSILQREGPIYQEILMLEFPLK